MSLQSISAIKPFDTPLKASEIESRIRRERELEKRRLSIQRLQNSGIEREFWSASIDSCEPVVQDYAAKLFSGEKKSLIIQGDTGVGKTYAASAIAIKAMENAPARSIDAANLGSAAMDDHYASILRGTPLLIIDDLGNEHRSEWSNAFLFSLLKRRMSNNIPTIITTQYTDHELANQLSQSADLAYRRTKALLSRFGQYAVKIHLEANDRRL